MFAFVGESGAGKTTLVQMISRFYDVTKGRIRIGGVDVREIDYEKLLKNISVVFQHSFLTRGTVFGVYTCTLYLPIGVIVLLSSLLVIPAMALSVRGWLAGGLEPAALNLLISKDKINVILDEQEEKAEDAAFSPDHFEVTFQDVDFSYAAGEPVLQKAGFTILEMFRYI